MPFNKPPPPLQKQQSGGCGCGFATFHHCAGRHFRTRTIWTCRCSNGDSPKGSSVSQPDWKSTERATGSQAYPRITGHRPPGTRAGAEDLCSSPFPGEIQAKIQEAESEVDRKSGWSGAETADLMQEFKQAYSWKRKSSRQPKV